MRKGTAGILRVVTAILVSVFLNSQASSEMAVMKWEVFHNSPGGGAYDQALFVAFDGSGNVYVTGRTESDFTGTDTVTIKYDPEGNELWMRSYDGGDGGKDMPYDMVSDPMGNVYIAGSSAVIKYDTQGNLLWALPCEVRYNAIKVDEYGGIYVTGYEYTSGSSADYSTMKLDSQGIPDWTVTFNGAGNGTDKAVALVLDGSGNIYGITLDGSDNVYLIGTSLRYYSKGDYVTLKYSQQEGPTPWGPASSVAGVSGGPRDGTPFLVALHLLSLLLVPACFILLWKGKGKMDKKA